MAFPTSIDLQIVTPDRPIVREQVDEVQIPGSQGYLGVLPGHTPLLTALAVGELWYRKGQEKTYVAIACGFVEILPDRVTVLAKLAERAEDIDLERAEVGAAASRGSADPHERHRLRAGARRAPEVADPSQRRVTRRRLAAVRRAQAAEDVRRRS